MGAEVIKMESLRVYDSHRGPVTPAPGIAAYPDSEPGEEPWNRNGWFNCLHMSKYGITLELTHEAGRRGVRGTGFDQRCGHRKLPSGVFGTPRLYLRDLQKDSARRHLRFHARLWQQRSVEGYVAYGIGQEQLSGMAHMTGYQDDGPMKSGINHGDPITGSHAAGVLLAALRYAQTHRPGHVRRRFPTGVRRCPHRWGRPRPTR